MELGEETEKINEEITEGEEFIDGGLQVMTFSSDSGIIPATETDTTFGFSRPEGGGM